MENKDNQEVKEQLNIKRIIIKYSICVAFNIFICVTCLFLRNFLNLEAGTKEFYRAWSDSFTIPGLLSMLFALLLFLVSQGSLTALGYMLKRVVKSLIPFSKKDDMTYYEYQQSRKKLSGYLCILWVGLVFFMVGIVFLILFYTA